MIEILEQAIELYEKDRKERKKAVNDSQRSKENVAPRTSQVKTDKRQFEDAQGEQNISSKKRKIN